MAKKSTESASAPKAKKTAVRNSPIPKAAPAVKPSIPASVAKPSQPVAAKPVAAATATTAPAPSPRKQVTQEEIAQRAYEIWKSGRGGSEFENWVRAERELRG